MCVEFTYIYIYIYIYTYTHRHVLFCAKELPPLKIPSIYVYKCTNEHHFNVVLFVHLYIVLSTKAAILCTNLRMEIHSFVVLFVDLYNVCMLRSNKYFVVWTSFGCRYFVVSSNLFNKYPQSTVSTKYSTVGISLGHSTASLMQSTIGRINR